MVTRRWILGAAGLLVAAPSIVRASSLMTMPRAPVIVPPPAPPGLWLEFFDRLSGKVCRVPCMRTGQFDPRSAIEGTYGVDLKCTVPTTMMVHEIRVGRGDERLLSYAPDAFPPLVSGMDVRLGVDVVDGKPETADFAVRSRPTVLKAFSFG